MKTKTINELTKCEGGSRTVDYGLSRIVKGAFRFLPFSARSSSLSLVQSIHHSLKIELTYCVMGEVTQLTL